MAWFQKQEKVPRTGPDARKAPSRMEGLWSKCDACEEIVYRQELEQNLAVCPRCGHHQALGAAARILAVVDPDSFEEHDAGLGPQDPLGFVDSKKYRDRIKTLRRTLGSLDAFVSGMARLDGHAVAIGAFEFEFMGGSMGSVVGEKLTRLFERAAEQEASAIVFSASGGARMQEGIFSLMQMARTSAAIARFRATRRPYVSVLCNPTTGGVAASFSWLGDVILAEPKALIGFAGPRVIEQTIRQKLPEGFQRAEFLVEHGMVDAIVPRRELREKLAQVLGLLAP
ncbi:MAG: acetyl-CoA carboxylase, carboxyltransferase subunit beta [Deltaproteobacteria bacterium]